MLLRCGSWAYAWVVIGIMALRSEVVGAAADLPWDAAVKTQVQLPSIDLQSVAEGEVLVFQTSRAGDRLREARYQLEPPSVGTRLGAEGVVRVNPKRAFQEVIGFGGALTDAVALNLRQLAGSTREAILDTVFAANGTLRYSLARVPLGSCDFSTHVYSYDEVEGDLSLSHFNISEDWSSGKLPLVKDVLSRRPDLRLFTSPWSAPAWMKTSQSQVGGELRGPVGGEYHQAWALYFSRFLSAYQQQGIRFWAVTAQNEPRTTGKSPWAWQTMAFTAETQRDFIKLALGPRLSADHPGVQIMMLDDQRRRLPDWADTVMSDPEAAVFVSGVGVHWYAEAEDLVDHFERLRQTHDRHPHLFILGTEACNGYMPPRGPRPGYWRYGEAYGHDILNDLNNYAAGWVDWNILLDTTGGPNWAGNRVDAPILVDPAAGRWWLQPSFYYLAHFSRFMPPGSRRAAVDVARAPPLHQLEATAVVDGSGLLVVVMMNRGAFGFHYRLEVQGLGQVRVELPARAIQTVVLKLRSGQEGGTATALE